MEKLKEYLEEQDYTVKEFSNEMGVTEQSVYGWLRGDHYPSRGNLKKIGRVFDLSREKRMVLLRQARRVRKKQRGGGNE